MSQSSQNWRDTLIFLDSKIKDAIQTLNMTGLKIVIVVDSGGKLLGTISDGDIRRGLLKGLNIDSPISDIIYRDTLVIPAEMDAKIVMQLMITNKIFQIPIVNEANQVVGLQLYDEIIMPAERSNLMVIMAGGRGSRLYPQTENCPKPLLPIAGRPILEHIITQAKTEGFKHFVIAIHYLGYMIEEYFGNGQKMGVKIEYLKEEKPLGTAGALSLFENLPNLPIVVTNGDVITDIRYAEILNFHEEQGAAATMAVRSHEWKNPFGVVQIQGVEIISYDEKPTYRSNVNAGVYVLNPSLLRFIPKSQPFDMPSLFEIAGKNSERTVAYPVHEQWLDVGRPKDLLQAENQAKRNPEN
jgi:dTDP-glucose pyrophosphorylase